MLLAGSFASTSSSLLSLLLTCRGGAK